MQVNGPLYERTDVSYMNLCLSFMLVQVRPRLVSDLVGFSLVHLCFVMFSDPNNDSY